MVDGEWGIEVLAIFNSALADGRTGGRRIPLREAATAGQATEDRRLQAGRGEDGRQTPDARRLQAARLDTPDLLPHHHSHEHGKLLAKSRRCQFEMLNVET
jgi:hypothetical protein